MKKAYFNWSSGKDSAFALFKVLQSGTYNVQTLFTTIKKEGSKVAMHEVGIELIQKQANAIGIPFVTLEYDANAPSDEYKKLMEVQMAKFKKSGIDVALFGDLYLESLRNQRIANCRQQDIQAEFPLWNSKPKELLQNYLSLGFQSIVTCVDGSVLDKSFVGRIIDETFFNDLPDGVDPCGENGEYHSFVFDGPIFHKPVEFEIVSQYSRDYLSGENATLSRYWFLEIR